MGFLSWIFGSKSESRAMALDSSVGFFGGGGYNDSGVSVTELSSLAASAVYSCCQVIAQAVAQLPVHIFTRGDGAKLYDHPIARLLAAEPNEYMTAAAFREALMLNLCLFGNGYAFIDKDERGVPIGLYPLRSDRTRPVREKGVLLYATQMGGVTQYLSPDRVFHVLNFSMDGITGISPIQQARQNVGLSIALERYAARLFGSGCNPGGILQVPQMKEEALRNFVASWRANYSGIESAFKVAVLPAGFDFKPTSIEPEKNQMVAARVHQVREVARIYRVPLHMLGDLEKASYASIEQQSMDFYQSCIAPHVVKLEQEANRKLLLEREKPTHEVRFNLDAMLRASTQERYNAYNTGRQGGWLSVNDIRRKESMPPIEGGDTYLSPLNMTPVGQQPTNTPPPGGGDSTAARSLIEDAARRILTKESKALLRAAKKLKGDELRTWAEQFYRPHAGLVARVLAAPMKAAGLSVDPAEVAADHVAASMRSVESVAAGANADDIADEWIDIRAAEFADQLLKKE